MGCGTGESYKTQSSLFLLRLELFLNCCKLLENFQNSEKVLYKVSKFSHCFMEERIFFFFFFK